MFLRASRKHHISLLKDLEVIRSIWYAEAKKTGKSLYSFLKMPKKAWTSFKEQLQKVSDKGGTYKH